MRIGILGAGNMAEALGRRWTEAGHELLVAGRRPERAAELAARIGGGACAGSFRDAAAFGEVILLAVRREGVFDALREAGAAEGSLAARLVVDCTNPIVEADDFRLATADGPSMGSLIAIRAPGARIFKAFNLCHHSVYGAGAKTFDGRPLAIPYCGDGPDVTRGKLSSLIGDVGAVPVDLGGIDRAGQLEAFGAVIIAMLVRGVDPHTAIAPVSSGESRPGEEG